MKRIQMHPLHYYRKVGKSTTAAANSDHFVALDPKIHYYCYCYSQRKFACKLISYIYVYIHTKTYTYIYIYYMT